MSEAEDDDSRGAYAGLTDVECAQKVALLGDLAEAKRLAAMYPRDGGFGHSPTPPDDGGAKPGAPGEPGGGAAPAARLQPSFFEQFDKATGMTPLIVVAARGDLPFVQWLVEEEECDKQAASRPKGMTPFFAACSCNRLEVAKYLASKNVDVSRCAADGTSPAGAAAWGGHKKVHHARRDEPPNRGARRLGMTRLGNARSHCAV